MAWLVLGCPSLWGSRVCVLRSESALHEVFLERPLEPDGPLPSEVLEEEVRLYENVKKLART